MKVNMALLEGEEEVQVALSPVKEADPVIEVDVAEDEDEEDEEDEDDDEDDDEIDESDSHSKLKTFLLVAVMVGGFGLFVWNMTGLVNNMRLNNQGRAVNVVNSVENLGSFMNSGTGSGATAVDAEEKESEVSTDAARDGPSYDDSGGSRIVIDASGDESEDMAALRKELEDAVNEAALVKQELKVAEDMLDSALAREAERSVD